MKRLLFLLIACAVSAVSSAQLVQVTHELITPFAGNPGEIGDYYHIYADLQDPTDFLSAVYAAGNDNLLLGGADGFIINSASGAVTGDAIATAFCGFVPDLCFDSHVTIGYRNDIQYYDFSPIICGGPVTAIASLPGPTVIDDAFGNNPVAPNLVMDDGSWFTPNIFGCNDNGFGIGANNRVLIAVLNTTPGVEPVYELNIQVFNEADGNDILYYVGDNSTVDGVDIDGSCLGLQYPSPANCVPGCTDPAACNFDPAASVSDPLLCCFDNCVTLTVTDGGFPSELIWELQDDLGNTIIADAGQGSVNDLCLPDGCYFMILEDSFGDGWNGATWTVEDTGGGTVYGTGTLSGFGPTNGDGPEAFGFGVPDPCGCTDPTACNFDPAAVNDDGSCILPSANDLCAGAVAVLAGTTLVDNTAACQNEIFGLCGTSCSSQDGWCSFECDEQSGVWFVYTHPGCETVTIATSGDGSGTLTDTQIAVYDGCGGNLIAANDDTGGLFSSVSLDCDAPAGDYWILVDGYNGDVGTCNLDITPDAVPCENGCTDPGACNYNACATVDDGSCCSPPNESITLVVDGGSFQSEVGWNLFDSGGGLVASGGAPFSGEFCLPADCYEFDMIDTFGDGWNGNTYEVYDCGGALIYSGDLDGATLGDGTDVGTDFLDIGNTGLCPVIGCTDPLACNYNSDATIDDGSCASDNDAATCPDLVSMITGGLCGGEDHTLDGATQSPETDWQFNFGTQPDRWHRFIATHVGVRISVTTSAFDAQVALFDGTYTELDEDDANFVVGDEILNYTGLTPGVEYYVAVGAYNAPASGMDYNICIEALPETRCDYPGQTASQCDLFKADWAGPYSVDYIFHFEDQNTLIQYDYATGAAFDYVQLYNVPDLPWGTTYNVWIDVVHEVTNGVGTVETITIDGTEICTLTIIDAPLSAVKASQNCANYGPHWLGDYIQSTPWVCGASDWEWEFTRTDVPELPILATSGSFFNLIQLGSVPGIVEGATYDVRVRAMFPNGTTAAFGAIECVSTIGVAPSPTVGPLADGDNFVEERDATDEVAPLAAIYPNPNNGEFLNINLTNVETSIVTVDIYNQVGALVQSEQITVSAGNVNTIFELNGFTSGVYNVNIKMGDTVQTERLVIAK